MLTKKFSSSSNRCVVVAMPSTDAGRHHVTSRRVNVFTLLLLAGCSAVVRANPLISSNDVTRQGDHTVITHLLCKVGAFDDVIKATSEQLTVR